MSRPLPCCVDVPPAAAGLVRYGLEELLRGLGLVPEWSRRDGARLAVVAGVGGEGAPTPPDRPLVLPVSARALDALIRPAIAGPGRVEIEGEEWPLPVGPPGVRSVAEAGGDLVASAAWWLAGLQEAAAIERDRHGRFPYAASLQARIGNGPGGPLRPAVDTYRGGLGGLLRASGVGTPGQTWGGRPWALALTHDLDAVRTRRLAALAGEALRGRPALGLRRALGADARWQSVLALRDLAERHGARATWFVKGGAWAPEDVPTPLDGRYCNTLNELHGRGHAVGWHPGYGAHGHPARLRAERARLAACLGRAPRVARTHFLRWEDPATPRLLRANGVRIDSTLGFAEHEGFRRGTARPFRLYDPDAGRPADLWEMPLAVMDTTLYVHRGLSDEAAAAALADVLAAARRSGGVAVVLWHNSIDGDPGWRRRLDTLDHAIGQAVRDGAAVAPLPDLLQAWEGHRDEI